MVVLSVHAETLSLEILLQSLLLKELAAAKSVTEEVLQTRVDDMFRA